MTRLTDAEREELRAFSRARHVEPPLPPEDLFVASTADGRLRYIGWVTQASKFFKGKKPVRFRGDHWRL